MLIFFDQPWIRLICPSLLVTKTLFSSGHSLYAVGLTPLQKRQQGLRQ
jgi:hypothetical protein